MPTLALLLVPLVSLLLEPPAGAAEARGVDAILADHVAAVGGKAVLGKRRSLHVKRKVTIKGMGIEGVEERWAATGDRFLSVTNIQGIGTVRQGSDGKTFWSEDPINGLRVLAGREREQARLDGAWNAELRLKELFKKVAPVPPPANAKKGADALECLELTPAEGHATTVCFDVATHHRVFQTGRQTTPQGEMPFESHFSEFKTFQGVSVPTREETTAGPATIEAVVSEVVFDQPIDAKMFKLRKPAAPKAASPAAPAKANAPGKGGDAPAAASAAEPAAGSP